MTEHTFQAQVSEVLSLVINSLYSHPEIFLRELLSNASDALDKERFLALTAPDSGAPLGIRLIPDREKKTLTIEDNGVGMDEAELIKNLGTIAHSGSREFAAKLKEQVEAREQNKNLSLIGQFGVGFYSAYLVADRVEVISRKRGTSQAHLWVSDGKQGFRTDKAEREGRGTSVILHFKDEHLELLEPRKLRELVARYSDYIAYPIELAKAEGGEAERINQASALWQRKPSDITSEQYAEFYKHLSHDFEAPLAHKHFHVEGTQEFTGLLFVPKRPPFDLFSPDERHGVRLHVKRVFIMDDCKELLPRWLRFVRGVVDSEDLPLNVSREILQDSKVIRIIKKQVVKQVLDMLEEIASERPDDYVALWKSYGAVLKEGLHFDPEYKDRLGKLMRWETSHGPQATSLADYVARMKEGQRAIYYLIGPNRRTVESSPHLESLRARGYEVLYLIDPVDQWAVAGLTEFEGKPLCSAMDEKLELDAKEEKSEQDAEPKEAEPDVQALLARFKEVLEAQVSEVRASTRLTDSPVCLVVPEGGLGPYIERILRLQQGFDLPVQKRIMEVNASHPLVEAMLRLHRENADSEELRSYIELLYDQALLSEGSPVEDPARIARRLTSLMQKAVQASAPA